MRPLRVQVWEEREGAVEGAAQGCQRVAVPKVPGWSSPVSWQHSPGSGRWPLPALKWTSCPLPALTSPALHVVSGTWLVIEAAELE